jgi:MFS family permease
LEPTVTRTTGPKTALFLIVFVDLIGFGIVIPLLPLYGELHTPSPWQLGLLMASFSAMQLVFSPLLGRLSDRVGRRPVLLISLTGSLAGYLLFAVADSMFLLVLSRVVAGIAGANIATAQAVIADITPPAERARGMGLIGAAFGLGFIAGPALAGILVTLSPAAPGLGAAAFSAAAWILTAVHLPETHPPERRRGGLPTRWGITLLADVGKSEPVRRLLAVGFLVVMGFAAFEVTFAQFLNRRAGLGPAQVAFVFVYVGFLAALVQGGLVGPVTRRLGERRVAAAGLLAIVAGLTVLAASHTLPLILATLPVLALGQGLSMPAVASLVSRHGGTDTQGLVLGAFQGVSALARVVGPVFGQMALGTWGPSAPLLGASVLALAACLALMGSREPPPAGTRITVGGSPG